MPTDWLRSQCDFNAGGGEACTGSMFILRSNIERDINERGRRLSVAG